MSNGCTSPDCKNLLLGKISTVVEDVKGVTKTLYGEDGRTGMSADVDHLKQCITSKKEHDARFWSRWGAPAIIVVIAVCGSMITLYASEYHTRKQVEVLSSEVVENKKAIALSRETMATFSNRIYKIEANQDSQLVILQEIRTAIVSGGDVDAVSEDHSSK
jgi:hypothetical protein